MGTGEETPRVSMDAVFISLQVSDHTRASGACSESLHIDFPASNQNG